MLPKEGFVLSAMILVLTRSIVHKLLPALKTLHPMHPTRIKNNHAHQALADFGARPSIVAVDFPSESPDLKRWV